MNDVVVIQFYNTAGKADGIAGVYPSDEGPSVFVYAEGTIFGPADGYVHGDVRGGNRFAPQDAPLTLVLTGFVLASPTVGQAGSVLDARSSRAVGSYQVTAVNARAGLVPLPPRCRVALQLARGTGRPVGAFATA